MNGERQLQYACQVSCGQPLSQSPSSPHQFSLDVAALFALSIVASCQKLTHSRTVVTNDKGEITWCGCGLHTRARGGGGGGGGGFQSVIFVRGHNVLQFYSHTSPDSTSN